MTLDDNLALLTPVELIEEIRRLRKLLEQNPSMTITGPFPRGFGMGTDILYVSGPACPTCGRVHNTGCELKL
jgi:hypothetical protein